jgi:hypothetical protein
MPNFGAPGIFPEQSSPSNPPSGRRAIFAKSDGFYERDSSGVETKLTSAGGGGVWAVSNFTDVSALNTTAETTLLTASLPADTLGANDFIQIRSSGLYKISGATAGVTLRLKYGDTTLLTTHLENSGSTPDEYEYVINSFMFADGTSAQKADLDFSAKQSFSGGLTEIIIKTGSGSEATNATKNIILTAQMSVAGANIYLIQKQAKAWQVKVA